MQLEHLSQESVNFPIAQATLAGIRKEGNHPNWFDNIETLHPLDDAHIAESNPAKRKAMTLWWAELTAK